MQSLQSPVETPTSLETPGAVVSAAADTPKFVCADPDHTDFAYTQLTDALMVNGLLALLLVGVLWPNVAPTTLLVWLSCVLATTVTGAWLVKAYLRSRLRDGQHRRWNSRLTGITSLNAVVWGICPLLMLGGLGIGQQAVVLFALVGAAVCALPALAHLRHAYLGYIAVLIVPCALWFSSQPDDVSFTLGVVLLLGAGVIAMLGRSYRHGVNTAFALATRNHSTRHSVPADERVVPTLESQIEQRERAETSVRDSESRFRDFAELGADLFWEIDTKLRYVRVLGHCEEVLGVPATDLIGQTAAELVGDNVEDLTKLEAHLAEIAALEPFSDFKYTFRRPDGRSVVLSSSGKPTFAANGAYIGYRGVARNITEAHSLSEKLHYQATHDALTGLYNRHELERRLTRVIDDATEQDSEHALCFLDMDQFKVVNDTCGHSSGDELLRQLADLFRTQVRNRDTLARLGGDEFALLLEHCSIDQAHRAVSGLREAVCNFKFEAHGRVFKLGASIGVVPIHKASGDMEQLMSDADSACYAAKEAGRNRIYVCRDGDDILSKRQGEMQWVSKITKALDDDRFCLYVQAIAPIRPSVPVRESMQLMFVDASEVEPLVAPTNSHFEVLVRMVDDDGSTIPPGAFLPAAEHYNLSPRLDRWVVRSTFDWLTANPAQLETLELCSINLSGNTLGDEEFGQFVVGELERTGVPASKVCFEITETAAIFRIAAATRLIEMLKDLGFKFALDDFGSGLSSFGYLKNLPVDILKIDGLFIRDITEDPINFALVKSINEVGQVMGKKTVAEFVENDEILNKLREIGVDFAQGYGIGKPRPIAELCS